MQGRAANLDHLEPGRALQHTMPDPRWLQYAIARLHHERRPLVLVNDAYPAPPTEDHLETDIVEMDIVRDRAAIRDHDMRGDEPAAEPPGDEVAVEHASAAGAPCGIVDLSQHQLWLQRPQDNREIGIDDLDQRPIWGRQQALSAGDCVRLLAAQADCSGRPDLGGIE